MTNHTHEVRLAQWKEIILQCQNRPAGQSAESWLKDNGFSRRQYYYWLHQIREEAYQEMQGKTLPAAAPHKEVTFAEIPVYGNTSTEHDTDNPSFSPDAMVCFHGVSVALSNTASEELVSHIFEAVSHAC